MSATQERPHSEPIRPKPIAYIRAPGTTRRCELIPSSGLSGTKLPWCLPFAPRRRDHLRPQLQYASEALAVIQRSAIFPATRQMATPVIARGLPVAGMPGNSPRCVPPKAKRATTLSPSAAIRSSTRTQRSGNISISQ
jgi:hypothetical protein